MCLAALREEWESSTSMSCVGQTDEETTCERGAREAQRIRFSKTYVHYSVHLLRRVLGDQGHHILGGGHPLTLPILYHHFAACTKSHCGGFGVGG
jgi:hypothetical protein